MAKVPRYRGLHVTWDSWDGSDMFLAADGRTAFLVVSEAVQTLFARAKVKNVKLTPLSDVDVIATDQPDIPKSGIGDHPVQWVFATEGVTDSGRFDESDPFHAD